MAAVFKPEWEKAVRVLQYKRHPAGIRQRAWGSAPKTSAWKRREQLPSSCPEVVMPGPGLL